MGHGLVELTGHQGLGHALLPTLPQEDGHLLALHEHSPHHELMKRVLEPTHGRVVHVDVNLFLFLLLLFLLPFGWRFIILG